MPASAHKSRITLMLYLLDGALILLATVLAYVARFELYIPARYLVTVPWVVLVTTIVYLIAFTALGTYRVVLRYVGVETAVRLASATLLAFAVLVGADLVFRAEDGLNLVPFGVLFIQAVLVLLFTAALRLSGRLRAHMGARSLAARGRRTLIVGAGSAGSLLLRDIENNPSFGLAPVGFLDDDPNLRGKTIRAIPVVGRIDELAAKVVDLDISEVIVALPSASRERVRDILNVAADAGVTTRIVPALVIAKGSVDAHDLRHVEVEDLLGREPAPIDIEAIRETVEGKVVAVTGAAGSIGSELCRQVIRLDPARLLLVEIDESRLYELYLELGGDASVAEMHLVDITEVDKLDAIFSSSHPDLVLHAAAYKHVPMMELAPDEAVRVNILGTKNVIEACERHGVGRFVLISTDKAVCPSSVMGASKAVAELLTVAAARRGALDAVAVRFGNVLGSRGSVVPLFEDQLRRGGPILVTHEEITRYFMTIPEASRLVLQAQAIGEPGDIFVLEMGRPIRILDLAHKMIALSGVPAEIEIIGLRPAEKLHEVLVHEDESLVETGAERVLRVGEPVALPADLDSQVDALIALRPEEREPIRQALGALVVDYCPFESAPASETNIV